MTSVLPVLNELNSLVFLKCLKICSNWPPGSKSVFLNYGSWSVAGSFLFLKFHKNFIKQCQYFIIINNLLPCTYFTKVFFHWLQKCPGRIWIRICPDRLAIGLPDRIQIRNSRLRIRIRKKFMDPQHLKFGIRENLALSTEVSVLNWSSLFSCQACQGDRLDSGVRMVARQVPYQWLPYS